jgi:hypothetical protein
MPHDQRDGVTYAQITKHSDNALTIVAQESHTNQHYQQTSDIKD